MIDASLQDSRFSKIVLALNYSHAEQRLMLGQQCPAHLELCVGRAPDNKVPLENIILRQRLKV
jgi:hypothetical protein